MTAAVAAGKVWEDINWMHDDCEVCMVPKSERPVSKSATCGHVLHTDCFDEWLKSSNLCPVCRRDITVLVPLVLPGAPGPAAAAPPGAMEAAAAQAAAAAGPALAPVPAQAAAAPELRLTPEEIELEVMELMAGDRHDEFLAFLARLPAHAITHDVLHLSAMSASQRIVEAVLNKNPALVAQPTVLLTVLENAGGEDSANCIRMLLDRFPALRVTADALRPRNVFLNAILD